MKNILLNTSVVLTMVVVALSVYAFAIRDSSGVIYKEAVVKAEFGYYAFGGDIDEFFQHYQDSIYKDSLQVVIEKPNARFGYYSFVGKWRMLMDSVQWLNVGVNFKPNYPVKCPDYNIYCNCDYHYTGTLVEVNLQYNLTYKQRIENVFGSVENELHSKVDSLFAAIGRVKTYRRVICRSNTLQNINILVRE